jgi:hypothetical protein
MRTAANANASTKDEKKERPPRPRALDVAATVTAADAITRKKVEKKE